MELSCHSRTRLMKRSRTSADPYDYDRPRKNLAYHKPENARMIEKGLLRYECQLIALIGASALAEDQLEELKQTKVCPLCEKNLTSEAPDDLLFHAMYQLQLSHERYVEAIEHGDILKKRRALLVLLNELKKKQIKVEVNRSKARFQLEFKKGRVCALTEQKRASLRLKKCLCCGSSLLSLPTFLKQVDCKVAAQR